MKKASFIVMGLGLAVTIFAVVCFIVAGNLIDTAEEQLFGGGYWLQMGDTSGDIDHVALMKLAMQEVGGFTEFAYYNRVWVLVAGCAVLAIGIVLLVIGLNSCKKRKTAGPTPSGYGMVCPSCGAPMAANTAFCMNCGASLAAKPASIKPVSVDRGPAGTFCTGCGAYVEAGSRFCMSCGTPVPGAAAEPAAAPAAAPVSGGASYVGSSTGTISATVVKGDAGTIRLDTTGTSSGTMRIDTRAVAEPEPFVKHVEEERPAASSGTVMINIKSKPEEPKPAPAKPGKGRLSKAGDL